MKNYFILFILIQLTPTIVRSQETQEWDIKQIDLKNTFLYSEIQKLIDEEIANDPTFKKNGYINIYVKSFSEKDTLRIYFINTSYDDKISSDGKASYPHFYSFISSRLVCYYISVLSEDMSIEFSNKSTRRFQNILSKNIPTDNKLNEVHKMHGGKFVYILKNGENVVIQSRY